MNTTDAIIAVASPPGRSARSIVRISGADLSPLLVAMFTDQDATVPAMRRGIARAKLNLGNGLTLPILALTFPGPKSYTGEDVIELVMPGNPVLLDRVIDRFLTCCDAIGISLRRAEPGEFTARAFMRGRIDLTEAEGVAATIAARSDAELRAAGMMRTGALGRQATALADELADALALVEAGIDFTDQEDVVAIAPRELASRLRPIRNRLDAQLSRAVGMEQLEAIPWVVLTGPPNAGKSTLFNALLGRERAVVSNVAGTTRDALIEPLRLGRAGHQREVLLVDLAGADDNPSEINRMMQAAAAEATRRAELILYCLPVVDDPPPLREGTILVRTKADLTPTDKRGEDPRVSAKTGEGVEELRARISKEIGAAGVSLAADMIALSPRHEASLHEAKTAIEEALTLIEPSLDQRRLPDAELIAASLRSALDALASLAGRMTPDDVLGRIFARFCVGK